MRSLLGSQTRPLVDTANVEAGAGILLPTINEVTLSVTAMSVLFLGTQMKFARASNVSGLLHPTQLKK